MGKRVVAIVLSVLVLFVVSSCGFAEDTLDSTDKTTQKPSDSTDKSSDFKPSYVTTTCKSTQWREKISVVDGKVYRMWVDVKYNDVARDSETFYLDVYDNGSWKNISVQEEKEFTGAPYFDKTYTYPLYEKVGDKIIYTDPKNDFYILDFSAQKSYDLEMNLEDWRAFATDGESVFAVLSAFANRDGEAEIRIYDIRDLP